MIKNYTEVVVDEVFSDLLKTEGEGFFACTCEVCVDSIKAIALNKLKPFYITCKVGEVFGKYKIKEFQLKTDVVTEIVKAKDTVACNPHHDDEARKSLEEQIFTKKHPVIILTTGCFNYFVKAQVYRFQLVLNCF